MSNTDEGKPAGKSGQRSRKGERGKKTVSKKRPPETPAPVELQSPDQDQPLQPQPVHAESPKVDEPTAIDEPIEVAAASPEPPPPPAPSPAEPAAAEPATAEPALASPALPERVESALPEPATAAPALVKPATAAPTPVTLQTITNAYRDYTRKSFEDFGSFFEQLSGARSLEKAMSVHSEFVKRAYETSVAESQKICELHSKLARQTLEPLQGLVSKARETRGKS